MAFGSLHGYRAGLADVLRIKRQPSMSESLPGSGWSVREAR